MDFAVNWIYINMMCIFKAHSLHGTLNPNISTVWRVCCGNLKHHSCPHKEHLVLSWPTHSLHPGWCTFLSPMHPSLNSMEIYHAPVQYPIQNQLWEGCLHINKLNNLGKYYSIVALYNSTFFCGGSIGFFETFMYKLK